MLIDEIAYIGKEVNNIEETLSGLEKPNYTTYQNKKELKKRIMKLTPIEARLHKIKPNTLWRIKRRGITGKPLNLRNKVLSRI